MSSDLMWTEASLDHEVMAREAALDRATAELHDGVLPFLLAARSDAEYEQRVLLAGDRLTAIAFACGIEPGEIRQVADRYYAIRHEALMEGQDPVLNTVNSTPAGYGQGPEKPVKHDEGPDFSHGYSEVPQGAPGGPDPRVVTPQFPGPGDQLGSGEQGTEGAGPKTGRKKHRKAARLRRQAEAGDYLTQTPPDLGTGMGSTDVGLAGEAQGPPSVPAGSAAANMPAGVPFTPPSVGRVTSSLDPVHSQVLAVTASVRASNPWLDEGECRRIARQAVGRYLRTADTDWSPSIVRDAPPVQTGGHGGGGGGGNPLGHMLEGQGLRSMLPGMGGGAAAGGEAGGAMEVAELAAL